MGSISDLKNSDRDGVELLLRNVELAITYAESNQSMIQYQSGELSVSELVPQLRTLISSAQRLLSQKKTRRVRNVTKRIQRHLTIWLSQTANGESRA
jgi:hypothetical protein